MMTVNKCKAKGVSDLMVVHDSFSTTVGNVPVLAAEVRKAFVELFEENDPYSDLKEQTLKRVADKLVVPELGVLNIKRLRTAITPFS